MAISQKRSRRKPTGGRYKQLKVRRQHEAGGEAAMTRVGAPRTKTVRTLGGNEKHKLLAGTSMSVVDPKTNKHVNATISTVIDNPANRNFIRRNILTKGTVVETDKGTARITSRPGQHGTLQGVLVQ